MLKRVIVHNLRGYAQPTLELQFHRDLNLVTGRNGAGKTTLLKLCWYLISGNIHLAANETPFSLATIESDDYSMTVDLTNRESPQIIVDRGGDEYPFRSKTSDENDEDDLPDFDDDGVLERAGSFTEDFGSSIFFPTFRRVEGGYTIPREARQLSNNPIFRNARQRAPLEEGLSEISRRLSNMRHQFVCSISTNDIVELVLNKFNSATEQYSLAQQRLSNDIIGQIRKFEQKSSELDIEKADDVLERIRRSIEHVDGQRVELMAALNAVQKIVVDLFTHKGIAFGSRYSFGEKAEAVFSENLSAGEKQMLSFICYNAFFDNSVIFIDEPELSLHVDWQRQLFPILEEQATSNQFIVATHSPFIYGKYPEKEILLNPDRGE